jgi:hypothetical protein
MFGFVMKYNEGEKLFILRRMVFDLDMVEVGISPGLPRITKLLLRS